MEYVRVTTIEEAMEILTRAVNEYNKRYKPGVTGYDAAVMAILDASEVIQDLGR